MKDGKNLGSESYEDETNYHESQSEYSDDSSHCDKRSPHDIYGFGVVSLLAF